MNSAKTKVALVTGAGTGIGKAAAKALLKGGYQVVLTGRNLDKLEKAIAEKTMEIKNSRSGDLILYKFIEKKRSENREVEKMLEEASI